MPTSRSRRARWLAPVAVVLSVTIASTVPKLLPAGADAAPVLPDLTPAQLLDKVRTNAVTSFSGAVTFTARLGLPDVTALGGLAAGAGPTELLGLLSGTHNGRVWMADADHVRLALDQAQNETDWIRNGADAWSWESASQQVKHVVLPAERATNTDGDGSGDHAGRSAGPPVDPAQMATDLLARIDPTTNVTVRTPGYVAGRPVYELVVSPRSPNSTVGAGIISVDAATGFPLAVRIEAASGGAPALEATYTAISFDRPADKLFDFHPPVGAKVSEVAALSDLVPLGYGGHGDGHRRRDAARAATQAHPQVAAALPASGATSSKSVGEAWETVEIVGGAALGGQFRSLLDQAPSVTLPDGSTAQLITTQLLNVLVMSDGRLAIGAVTPAALIAAAGSR